MKQNNGTSMIYINIYDKRGKEASLGA